MAANNPKRREHEAVWAEMKRLAIAAEVRPPPASSTRSQPGNHRYGDLKTRYDREVLEQKEKEKKKYDKGTGASPLVNPAPAKPPGSPAPATSTRPPAPATSTRPPAPATSTRPPAPATSTSSPAPAVPPRSPVYGPQLETSIPGPYNPNNPVWMGKSGGAGSGARVLAPDAAAVERLKRAGYSVLDQVTPSAGEKQLFGEGAKGAKDARDVGTPGTGRVAVDELAPGVYDESGRRMPSPQMVSATGTDQSGQQFTWYATARNTEDVIIPDLGREEEGPTPVEIERELSKQQYRGYSEAQARLAQEDAARIAGESDSESVWDRFDRGISRRIDALRTKLGPLSSKEEKRIQEVS